MGELIKPGTWDHDRGGGAGAGQEGVLGGGVVFVAHTDVVGVKHEDATVGGEAQFLGPSRAGGRQGGVGCVGLCDLAQDGRGGEHTEAKQGQDDGATAGFHGWGLPLGKFHQFGSVIRFSGSLYGIGKRRSWGNDF